MAVQGVIFRQSALNEGGVGDAGSIIYQDVKLIQKSTSAVLDLL